MATRKRSVTLRFEATRRMGSRHRLTPVSYARFHPRTRRFQPRFPARTSPPRNPTRDAQRVGPRTTLKEKMGPERNRVWLV